MDALGQVLSSVRVTGAIFFSGEFSAPWAIATARADDVAPLLAPGTERLVIYHLLTEGQAWIRVDGGEEVALVAGDLVVIPHGDAHLTTSRPAASGPVPPLFDRVLALSKLLPGELLEERFGGGGAISRFVCGYFGCERHAGRLFLAGLPPLMRINLRGDAAGQWLEGSIRYLVSKACPPGHARSVLLQRMADALLVETLRRYTDQLPPAEACWLAGACDPVVGGALALLHRRPWQAWTVTELAREAGTSRSVLGERFVRFVGEPPLKYLARWRLQLAARLLQTTSTGILRLASDVGYASESAFNRAFKREFGLPPAQYRKAHAPAAATAGDRGPTSKAPSDDRL
jgi:AraC-like DNA-binding protein